MPGTWRTIVHEMVTWISSPTWIRRLVFFFGPNTCHVCCFLTPLPSKVSQKDKEEDKPYVECEEDAVEDEREKVEAGSFQASRTYSTLNVTWPETNSEGGHTRVDEVEVRWMCEKLFFLMRWWVHEMIHLIFYKQTASPVLTMVFVNSICQNHKCIHMKEPLDRKPRCGP